MHIINLLQVMRHLTCDWEIVQTWIHILPKMHFCVFDSLLIIENLWQHFVCIERERERLMLRRCMTPLDNVDCIDFLCSQCHQQPMVIHDVTQLKIRLYIHTIYRQLGFGIPPSLDQQQNILCTIYIIL